MHFPQICVPSKMQAVDKFVDKESLWHLAEMKFFSKKFRIGYGNVVLNRMMETLLQLIAMMLA